MGDRYVSYATGIGAFGFRLFRLGIFSESVEDGFSMFLLGLVERSNIFLEVLWESIAEVFLSNSLYYNCFRKNLIIPLVYTTDSVFTLTLYSY